ncbi:hypothetical protein HOV36_gp35 [Salmonella phage ZCSE2]|uniref:Uncharacterized protein n=1 Tax=Salmonella phage ZCSE2 TaxID=2562175 RepID=A0A4D6DWC8_9CAUD|nr:hypothetical protein HOV36_gp35 [Salmonella phage ZCSE2]QBZ70538.1 hypothetical protein [Salmonella phage ZCSE2]
MDNLPSREDVKKENAKTPQLNWLTAIYIRRQGQGSEPIPLMASRDSNPGIMAFPKSRSASRIELHSLDTLTEHQRTRLNQFVEKESCKDVH